MKRKPILLAVFLLVFLSYVYAADKGSSSSDDFPEIHLLVDVSGSMKETDPANLRVSAIKMFIYLIKQKAEMSVSTFSTETNKIIPAAPVDDKFATLFMSKKNTIASDGAWTNIETALINANQSWRSGNKIIILMTDGHIDLQYDAVSAASKDRLIRDVIPNLQHGKVRVFNVGFSANADKSLLDTISARTNGISQIVRSSKDLDSTLYNIFTAIIKINGTAIKKNKDATRSIQIDKNINNLTLIFKKNENISKLYLTNPEGKKSAVIDLNQKNVSTADYDFIDIKKPTPGTWVLAGPEQDIERAIILTDVKLQSNFSSGSYFQNEVVPMTAYLEEEGKILDKPAVLDNMEMGLQVSDATNHYTYKIPYTRDGKFEKALYFNMVVGHYNLVLAAQNKYLSRQLQFIIDLMPFPFVSTLHDSLFSLQLNRPDLIDPQAISIKTEMDHVELDIPIVAQQNNTMWGIDFSSICQIKKPNQKAFVTVQGKIVNSRAVVFRIPIKVTDICGIHLESKVAPAPLFSSLAKIVFKKVELVKKNKPQNKPVSSSNKVIIFTISILGLSVILFGVIFIIRSRYNKKLKAMKDDLNAEAIAINEPDAPSSKREGDDNGKL